MPKESKREFFDTTASLGSTSSDAVARIIDSARRGELVVIIGTGISLSMTNGRNPALSWKGLISDGFAYGVKKGTIKTEQAEGWKTQLESSDLDDLLAAAEFIGRKLNAPNGDLYARWLQEKFEVVKPTNPEVESAVCALVSSGVPLCTLNYDTLLEQATGLPSIYLRETAKVTAWMRREAPGILHLHGVWQTPDSCILGIRDYETTLKDDIRDLIQRSLASFRRLLFIGCGGTFSDPNFSALTTWLRRTMKSATPQHYALVHDSEVAERNTDPAWHGFVEPLGYGSSYDDLPILIQELFAKKTTPASKSRPAVRKKPVVHKGDAGVLQEYRTFLLKDCGQMTIEGVRADMDTAQRRFDLERLFVPLKLLASPPDIPDNDPQRAEKLQAWHEENRDARPFGKVFSKHKRLALLALPGGGKTLLLKRLAVAYADPERRESSSDALPNLKLIPVLIRCREWREHIHRPILTLLRNLPDITGHTSLAGLVDVLIPLLKRGRVLLLIDGLDEIHDDAVRTIFVEHLERFLADYPKIRLVVTSREAGFNLVAPVLARFCDRWRVAPLEEPAITALCDHWHSLMSGESPEAKAESREVSEYLLKNSSLRRLAENPLLLTMLLVVKHGAGRLPPDRVSLYNRAVEVLLDTWNIKGHAPLNPKEAVPQLAYVAYEMMKAGKQTATERELLALIEDARDKVPQIRRYAKDAPHEFLRRVELRSSLLIEAGHQAEHDRTVPFYQFRHLTFQEYLAGVAATEGHYSGYEKGDTVLTPLADYLLAEEWKEVIPMTAVLARKQAEPLLASLVSEGSKLRTALENDLDIPEREEWSKGFPPILPAPTARLVQCLVEEAEATPETLSAALQLTAFFARGCRSADDWGAVCRGLYGDELRHQACLLYRGLDWPLETWLSNSLAQFGYMRRSLSYWLSDEGMSEVNQSLDSDDLEKLTLGLATLLGIAMQLHEASLSLFWLGSGSPLHRLRRHIFNSDVAVSSLAVWAWGLLRVRIQELPEREEFAEVRGLLRFSDTEILDRVVSLYLGPHHRDVRDSAGFAISTVSDLPRSSWNLVLSPDEVKIVKAYAEDSQRYLSLAAPILAFYAQNVWSDEELIPRLERLLMDHPLESDLSDHIMVMLRELGSRPVDTTSSKRRVRRSLKSR